MKDRPGCSQRGMAKRRNNSSKMLTAALEIGNWQSKVSNVL
jgi:hypothetical protein